jgi:hypothetical protein
MSRLMLFIVLVFVLYFFSKKPEPRPNIPAAIIKKVIFGNETSNATSASSSDDGAPASAFDEGTPGPLTYPCTCRICMCKGPNYPLTEEEFERLKEDLRKAGSSEYDLQVELVNQLVQIDELKKENERLKVAAQPKAAVRYYYPTRSTYGNSYNSNCGLNGCTPARGGFFRRW